MPEIQMSMKNIYLPILCLCLTIDITQAQVIPSIGFENWETLSPIENPDNWTNSNLQAWLNGGSANVTASTDRHGGLYSAKLECISMTNGGGGLDTMPGYIINSGSIDGGPGGLSYSRGFPFTAQPDSFFAWIKPQYMVNDTGLVIVTFKVGGSVLYENIFQLYGTSTSWSRFAYDLLPFGMAPDTCIVAFVCTNPDFGRPGSKIYVDDLSFSGSVGAVPNGDFESWSPIEYDEPMGWNTTNPYTVADSNYECVLKDTSHHGGLYSMSVETVELIMFGGSKTGFATTGDMPGPGGLTGGFPFSGPAKTVSGWFKYAPMGLDTGRMFLILSRYDAGLDSTIVVGMSVYDFTSQANWTYFSFAPSYDTTQTIDTANFYIVASKELIGPNSQNAIVGSKIWIDDLWIGNTCNRLDTLSWLIDADSTCDNWFLHGRPGYNAYNWTGGTTTQSDTVILSGTYALTITDSNSCMKSDSVMITVVPCVSIEADLPQKLLTLYPNPARSHFFLTAEGLIPERGRITLFDNTGSMIYREEISNVQRAEINVELLPVGFYLIQLECGQGLFSKKLIKQ